MPTYSRTVVGISEEDTPYSNNAPVTSDEYAVTTAFGSGEGVDDEGAGGVTVVPHDSDARVAAMRSVDVERLAAFREAEDARAARLEAAERMLETHSHGLPTFGINVVGAAPPSKPVFLLQDSHQVLIHDPTHPTNPTNPTHPTN